MTIQRVLSLAVVGGSYNVISELYKAAIDIFLSAALTDPVEAENKVCGTSISVSNSLKQLQAFSS